MASSLSCPRREAVDRGRRVRRLHEVHRVDALDGSEVALEQRLVVDRTLGSVWEDAGRDAAGAQHRGAARSVGNGLPRRKEGLRTAEVQVAVGKNRHGPIVGWPPDPLLPRRWIKESRTHGRDPWVGRAGARLHQPQHVFMAWELMRLARALKDAGGVPASGNQRSEWDASCHARAANPVHR